ncbi:MAG: 16S rRNA (guanine(966)-N(2))-methyltransferase RsmD [Candidatus Latescibacterota bacterium]|nr:MAG: 16S rRNA (guanine(966)-N(2))-methyltransferase RsmD [Candidatus Latescibacterota bacterium]
MKPRLRIVAGRFRGRRLEAPEGRWLRPTADRMKESIYNVLQAWIPGGRVLDLFAGTGNLGLEACSRGAAVVVLVEQSSRARQVIASNVKRLELEREVEVIAGDAVRYLRSSAHRVFDVVLADPPYDADLERALAAALPTSGLRPGGCFVLQRRRSCSVEAPNGFRAWRTRLFGDTAVDFWVREEASDDAS